MLTISWWLRCRVVPHCRRRQCRKQCAGRVDVVDRDERLAPVVQAERWRAGSPRVRGRGCWACRCALQVITHLNMVSLVSASLHWYYASHRRSTPTFPRVALLLSLNNLKERNEWVQAMTSSYSFLTRCHMTSRAMECRIARACQKRPVKDTTQGRRSTRIWTNFHPWGFRHMQRRAEHELRALSGLRATTVSEPTPPSPITPVVTDALPSTSQNS